MHMDTCIDVLYSIHKGQRTRQRARTDGLAASRFNAELSLAATDRGTDRYITMTSMRGEVPAADGYEAKSMLRVLEMSKRKLKAVVRKQHAVSLQAYLKCVGFPSCALRIAFGGMNGTCRVLRKRLGKALSMKANFNKAWLNTGLGESKASQLVKQFLIVSFKWGNPCSKLSFWFPS